MLTMYKDILLNSAVGAEHAFFDERLTTVSAERVLMEAELDWRKRRKVVDKLAATIILQGYLDSNPRL